MFLFASGLCALVYQVAWLRLLRLIFGASTASSAATLGIFMGGLGLGSLILGGRVDRSANPLRLYARLEMGIALAAGLSPWAIHLIAMGYRGLGGTEVLGTFGGTLLRLLLSAIVLGIPTFLMGGTLPAAVRAITLDVDLGRRSLGMLYGTNTVGAVVGAGLTTFLLIEHLGTQKTLWLAALVNLLVALWAGSVARDTVHAMSTSEVDSLQAPLRRDHRFFVIAAAGGVGLAFFVLELVWYRMLGPILGGSTYTFGVILTVALAGVGIGGWLYSARPQSLRPTLLGFSLTCGLEAVLVLAPFALGDRLAILALTLRDLMVFGFEGLVAAWFV
ncbi:MAG: spermidine synthase, partial [Thermoanaerobaculia bacterium]|nr:spermidine synthase [Thermoanaerobaculia bacterium]